MVKTWSLNRPTRLVAVLLWFATSGCAAIDGKIPPRIEVATGHFLAGAARVELTPRLGYPMPTSRLPVFGRGLPTPARKA